MKDYSAMSDLEINKEVAYFKIGGDWLLEPTDEIKFTVYNLGVKTKNTVELPDYCNNPADAWPIIVENKISLDFDGDGYEPQQNAWCKASTQCGHVYYGSEKEPLRNAMIVYLQMMEGK